MGRETAAVGDLKLTLERDAFLRALIRDLTGTLQDVVGLDEVVGFVSVVGQRMGERLNHEYQEALGVDQMTAEQVAEVLVDLKNRIQGNFRVVELTDEKIVLSNTACPFAEMVHDRPTLCMMTSSMFGVIAADNLGYAKVVLEETIARNRDHCRVVIHLKPGPTADADRGREFYKA